MKPIGIVRVMLFVMTTFFVVLIVFKNEIIQAGFFQQFKLVNYLVIIIGLLSVVLYYIIKNKERN